MSVHYLPAPTSQQSAAKREALLDWLETHSRVMGFWLDCLVADGDEGELISLLHRQHCWLEMMQDRVCRNG